MLGILFDLCALLIVLVSLPGTLELLWLTLGSWLLRPTPRTMPQRPITHLAVVVPAHNEAADIGDCVASLLACEDGDRVSVVVVADNCEDDTAARAEAAGARVLVRNDAQHRGKGHALDFAFRQLLDEGVDALLVVDADTQVDPRFLVACRDAFEAGADALQCRYRVANPQASLRTRLMNIAFLAFNVVRPRGRAFWGLSVGIAGNGFGLHRDVLSRVPYEARSVVEDLEYHLRLVVAGFRVRFVDEVSVWSAMPSGGSAAGQQRSRWEGGRLRMMREWLAPLARRCVAGQWRLLEPLLELSLLPLAYHVMLLGLALLCPQPWVRAYGLLGVVVVSLHVATALRIGGSPRDLLALLVAPVYLLWKLLHIGSMLRHARPGAHWVRTNRERRDN